MSLDRAVNIAVNFIADREGFSLSAYWDVNGYAIGYGNHYYQNGNPVSSGDRITQAAAYDLLSYYAYQNASAILGQLKVPVTDSQLAALTSLRYNCGTITKDLLNLINSGAPESQILDQFRNTCITSGGVYNPDLADRRELEIGLYTSAISLQTIIPFALAGFVAWAAYKALK